MTKILQQLIDKQDNFEVVRDQLALLLITERDNQVQLATDDSQPNPEDWNFHVYTERANPWELYLIPKPDPLPIVNIWYDNSSFDASASDEIERQKTIGVFNIDCYGYAISETDGGTGHKAGDKSAALVVQRVLRLVRNILMSAINYQLQLEGTVWRRWPQTIEVFQPEQNGSTVQQVIGARLAFQVTFNEFSPQSVPETLEFINVDIKRTSDGLIVAEVDIDNAP